jgi:hypothetical protein
MGVLLRTSQSKTTAIETLDHNRLPMSVGLRSLEFATSVNVGIRPIIVLVDNMSRREMIASPGSILWAPVQIMWAGGLG